MTRFRNILIVLLGLLAVIVVAIPALLTYGIVLAMRDDDLGHRWADATRRITAA